MAIGSIAHLYYSIQMLYLHGLSSDNGKKKKLIYNIFPLKGCIAKSFTTPHWPLGEFWVEFWVTIKWDLSFFSIESYVYPKDT